MSDVWVPSGAESKDVEASGFVWLWLDSQHRSLRVREIPNRAPQADGKVGGRAAARTPTSPQSVGHPDLFLGEKGVTAFLLTPLTPPLAMGTLEYVTEHSESHRTASELKQAAPTPERCRGAALQQGAGNLRSFLLIDPSSLSLPS